MKRAILGIIGGAFTLFGGHVFAQEFELSMPVKCDLGKTCVIQQFVDHDMGVGVRDYACGGATYDGHRGTDFRVIDTQEFIRGVPVLAAAGGQVRSIRDGEADLLKRNAEQLAATKGKECGNAVLIDHGAGYETQYCHMRNGSVTVKPGQTVQQGQVIGFVGLSGRTQFPHLHISVRQENRVIDPFTGGEVSQTCGINETKTMWADGPISRYTYQPTQIIDLGIANAAVTAAQVEAGAFDDYTPTSDAPILVGFVRVVNLRKGDQISVAFSGPDGVIAEQTYPAMDRDKAVYMHYFGKKRPRGGWPRGAYSVYAEVLRDGETVTTDAMARRRGWFE